MLLHKGPVEGTALVKKDRAAFEKPPDTFCPLAEPAQGPIPFGAEPSASDFPDASTALSEGSAVFPASLSEAFSVYGATGTVLTRENPSLHTRFRNDKY
jgi:hypothetical protein